MGDSHNCKVMKYNDNALRNTMTMQIRTMNILFHATTAYLSHLFDPGHSLGKVYPGLFLVLEESSL